MPMPPETRREFVTQCIGLAYLLGGAMLWGQAHELKDLRLFGLALIAVLLGMFRMLYDFESSRNTCLLVFLLAASLVIFLFLTMLVVFEMDQQHLRLGDYLLLALVAALSSEPLRYLYRVSRRWRSPRNDSRDC